MTYDELDMLTNPDLVEEAETQASRSNFRPPMVKFTADIETGDIEPYDSVLNNGQAVRRVSLKLKNMTGVQVAEGRQPLPTDSFTLELGLPKRANANAEIALMVASASKVNPQVNSIKSFPGLKKVTFEERVHKYQGRANTGEKGADGKDVWKDKELSTYYYHVVSLGSIGSSAAPPPAAEPTAEALAKALELLDGKTLSEFNGAALRDKVIQEGHLAQAIADGSYISKVLDNRAAVAGPDGTFTVTKFPVKS